MAGVKELRVGAGLPMHEIGRAQLALRMVFWGWVLLFIEISSDGLDIFNDVLGAILVAMGVFRLSAFAVPGAFPILMRVVRVLAVVLVALEVLAGLPHAHWLLDSLSTFAQLTMLVVFPIAMMRLSNEAQLDRAAASWKTTTRLIVVASALQLGLGAAAVIALADGSPSRILAKIDLLGSSINEAAAGLLGAGLAIAVIVSMIAAIHFLLSTARMRRAVEAEDRPPVPAPTATL